jgi:hypothetical protein
MSELGNFSRELGLSRNLKAFAVWIPLVVLLKIMHNLAVPIVRFVESGHSGWVECELTDAVGRHDIISNQVPIFTPQD